MPGRASTVGERISGLEATVASMDSYSHERWHKLANDMVPMLALPERLTRDVAKIDAKVEVRINAVAKEMERAVLAAIKEAIAPIKAEMVELRTDVDALKAQSNKLTGAKLLLVFIMRGTRERYLARRCLAR
jgi:polyhydroxyalkanoate synthesis regulator phasin